VVRRDPGLPSSPTGVTRKQLAARVELWRRRLTPEWRIAVSTDEPDDGTAAQIQASGDYHFAQIQVARKVLADHLAEVDVTIVHELLHLTLREMRRVVDLVDGQVHPDVHEVLAAAHGSAEEAVVERLARVIARQEHPDGLVYGTTAEAPTQ
jgi:transcriptional regulator of heat shock response